MKYTFTIHDSDPTEFPEAASRREKIVMESRVGESDRHIALKILAYLLYRGETGGLPLRIEQGVGQRHKPDLVATNPESGRALLWIDCGQIETKRLGRIFATNQQARVVVVKATGREALLYARAAERFLPDTAKGEPVAYIGFDEEFLPAFLSLLRGANDIVVLSFSDVSGPGETGQAAILMNGERLDASIDCFTATALPGALHRRRKSEK